MKYKYSAGLPLSSMDAEKQWVHVDFPKDQRKWIKFRRGIKTKSGYWAVPGLESVCTVIALGSSVKEVMDKCLKLAHEVKGKGVDSDSVSFENLQESIDEGKKYGIPF
jgi:hypothetical protein